jgi:4-hydroxy-3-methylbut-2-enyl diphosphate reductase
VQVRNPSRLAFVTQTTLSVDDTALMVAALRARFPTLQAPRREDICYATQNRQDAVKKLLGLCDVLLVVGSRSSSNSNRLRELADRAGIPGYLVDGADDLKREWLDGKETIGVTAGASAPEVRVQEVVERLRSWGAAVPEEQAGCEEHVVFSLPRQLRA